MNFSFIFFIFRTPLVKYWNWFGKYVHAKHIFYMFSYQRKANMTSLGHAIVCLFPGFHSADDGFDLSKHFIWLSYNYNWILGWVQAFKLKTSANQCAISKFLILNLDYWRGEHMPRIVIMMYFSIYNGMRKRLCQICTSCSSSSTMRSLFFRNLQYDIVTKYVGKSERWREKWTEFDIDRLKMSILIPKFRIEKSDPSLSRFPPFSVFLRLLFLCTCALLFHVISSFDCKSIVCTFLCGKFDNKVVVWETQRPMHEEDTQIIKCEYNKCVVFECVCVCFFLTFQPSIFFLLWKCRFFFGLSFSKREKKNEVILYVVWLRCFLLLFFKIGFLMFASFI